MVMEVKPSGEANNKYRILKRAQKILNSATLSNYDSASNDFIKCGISDDTEYLIATGGRILNHVQNQQHSLVQSKQTASLCARL